MFVPLFNVNGLHIIVVYISYQPLDSRGLATWNTYIFMWYRDANKIVQAVRKKREEILLGYNRENVCVIRRKNCNNGDHASPAPTVSNETGFDWPRVKCDYRPVISVGLYSPRRYKFLKCELTLSKLDVIRRKITLFFIFAFVCHHVIISSWWIGHKHNPLTSSLCLSLLCLTFKTSISIS